MYLKTIDRKCNLNRVSTSSGLITATVKLSFPSAPNTQLCYTARRFFHDNISIYIATNIHTATNTVTVTLLMWKKRHKWTAFDNTHYVLLLLQEVSLQGDDGRLFVPVLYVHVVILFCSVETDTDNYS